MKVAVITPYLNEPDEMIRRAHESVLAQTHECTHFLVCDGAARPSIQAWYAVHLTIGGPHRDFGNTARGLGAISALNLGFDGFAFLDPDNWFAPDHVQSLVETCQATGAHVAFSDLQLVLVTGELCPDEIRNRKYRNREVVDTNCFFFTSKAAFFLAAWAMIPPQVGQYGDPMVYALIKRLGTPRAFTERKTAFYETRWKRHYLRMGRTPPPDAREVEWEGHDIGDKTWLTERLGLKVRKV